MFLFRLDLTSSSINKPLDKKIITPLSNLYESVYHGQITKYFWKGMLIK